MKRYLLGLLASGLVIVGLAGTPEPVSASDHGLAQQTVARAAQSGWTRARWYRGWRGGWRGGWYGRRYAGWRGGWYGPRYGWRGWYRPYRTYWRPYWGGYRYYGWPGYYGGYSVVTPYFGIWW